MKTTLFGSVVFLFLISCSQKQGIEAFWPAEKAPERIAGKVIADFFTRGDFWIYQTNEFYSIHYAEACAAMGIARMAGLLNDRATLEKLSERYRRVLTDSLPITGNHVDANVYGILPLELYRQTGEEPFREQGIALADEQWENPLPNGLTRQTRFWIDDIWMIGSLQTQAYRVTGNPVYIERAALELAAYVEKLQQANGLFFHGPEAPLFWGRGNGWVAAGLAEVLSELPEQNEHYPTLKNAYKKMMDALLAYQAENGMWLQLIDHKEAWEETSSTAMFGYALSLGVQSHILEGKQYQKAIQKAWLALVPYLNDEGKITEVCVGTGQQNNVGYYLDRPRVTGDFHG